MTVLDADEIAALFVADIEVGIDAFDYGSPVVQRTPYRAGVIKVAGSTDGPSKRDARIFEAAAIAQRVTGCPILTHCENGTGALEQVALLTAHGARPDHVALSHVDKIVDRGFQRELFATGVVGRVRPGVPLEGRSQRHAPAPGVGRGGRPPGPGRAGHGCGTSGVLDVIRWRAGTDLPARVVRGTDARARSWGAASRRCCSSTTRPGSTASWSRSPSPRPALARKGRRRGPAPDPRGRRNRAARGDSAVARSTSRPPPTLPVRSPLSSTADQVADQARSAAACEAGGLEQTGHETAEERRGHERGGRCLVAARRLVHDRVPVAISRWRSTHRLGERSVATDPSRARAASPGRDQVQHVQQPQERPALAAAPAQRIRAPGPLQPEVVVEAGRRIAQQAASTPRPRPGRAWPSCRRRSAARDAHRRAGRSAGSRRRSRLPGRRGSPRHRAPRAIGAVRLAHRTPRVLERDRDPGDPPTGREIRSRAARLRHAARRRLSPPRPCTGRVPARCCRPDGGARRAPPSRAGSPCTKSR